MQTLIPPLLYANYSFMQNFVCFEAIYANFRGNSTPTENRQFILTQKRFPRVVTNAGKKNFLDAIKKRHFYIVYFKGIVSKRNRRGRFSADSALLNCAIKIILDLDREIQPRSVLYFLPN